MRHSKLQQQGESHKLPMTWQDNSDLQLLLVALNVNLRGVSSAKEGSLVEVLRDDSNLAFSQSRQIVTREPETPPFHPCLGEFLRQT